MHVIGTVMTGNMTWLRAGERLRRRQPDPYVAARRDAALYRLAQGSPAGQPPACNFGMSDHELPCLLSNQTDSLERECLPDKEGTGPR